MLRTQGCLNTFFLPSVIPTWRSCELTWPILAPLTVTSDNFNFYGTSRNIEECAIFSPPCLEC